MSRKVAVITPVHNRRDITLLCLRSLARIEREGIDVDIFVVDDGSTDGTAEAINKQFPEVNVIEGDGNLWYTEGTNRGIREAMKGNPDYLLLINDDSVFDAYFLKNMLETAESHERSIVGPLLLLWDTPHRVFQVSPRWEVWSGGWRHWQHQTVWTMPDRPWEVDIIVGNCVLVPAAAVKEHGAMDSSRFPNFGDAEFTPRLKRKGWKLLIDPRARVFCQPNEPPVRIKSLGLKEKLVGLLWNLHHPHNLRRRFFVCIEGAPSFLSGATAFLVFLVRVAIGKNVESSWSENLDERPLSETFAKELVRS